jgi:hypothetical protein
MTGMCGEGNFVYEYEDAAALEEILGDRYHAVVANPPYITAKDPVLNKSYRAIWDACSGKYALSVPFAQRIYELAAPGGFTGQITANSFMKREFGRKLIEEFFPTIDLTLVIDTSGAYIPGHGTPTVLIFGRNRRPVTQKVRAVLGIRGEPRAPEEPAAGLVWSSILSCVDSPGSKTEYVSADDVDRFIFHAYPWNLSGGGASLLRTSIEAAPRRASSVVRLIGVFGITGADEIFLADPKTFDRHGVDRDARRQMVVGDVLRDWSMAPIEHAIFLYDDSGLMSSGIYPGASKWLWPARTVLWSRVTFNKTTYRQEGRTWWEWHQVTLNRLKNPLSIAFSFVATHNHFVLDRGGRVFKQSAPVIKLPEGASEEDHLRLLGLLNSSTACFWLKQVSHKKGGSQESGGGQADQPWSWSYEFTGTKLQEFPLPEGAPLELATRLDALAQELQQVTPAAVAEKEVPTRERLDAARKEWSRIRGEMISAQEELDWEVYGLYGLLGDDADALIGSDVTKPALELGQRAFEIALARKMAAGEEETQWFARHGSTPITELPEHWPADYRALVERRLEKIAEDPFLHLIERPECKRRWATKSWEEMESEALRTWLLDRLEDCALWFNGTQPILRTVAQLADAKRVDQDFVSVAQLYARDRDLLDVVRDLVRDQHVPGVAAWRYTESGMRIRKAWEETWKLQRREDAGEKVGEIPVPPKYKQADFREQAYWRNRGKLDVPKERFTSYPEASRDGTLLLGWAGFDHLQQAQALATYISERRELDAWGADQLTPLLAGLEELLFWLEQWHPDVDPDFGERPADAYRRFLDEMLLQLGLTHDDLTTWRPPAPTRGRRRRAAT